MDATTGRLVMIDGIDGSGKSTLVRAMADRLRERGKQVFDVGGWKRPEPPTLEDARGHDVIVSFEPTRCWVGSAIRGELAQPGAPYGARSVAHAFALDREIIYRRLILPALASGISVVQDRGVTSSIVYQPAMEGGPSLEEMIALPGNALALSRAPDDLILTRISPDVAITRVGSRGEERHRFERIEALRDFDERFRSDWFRELFVSRGSTIHEIDTTGTIEEGISSAKALIDQLLP